MRFNFCVTYSTYHSQHALKGYIGHKSLEDLALSRRNRCLTPFHSVTQPPNLGFWISRSKPCLYFYFGQNVTRTKNHVIVLQIVTRAQNYVIFKIFKYVFFYSINERNYSVLYFYINFFLFFCIKNKWGLHTTYPKREVP